MSKGFIRLNGKTDENPYANNKYIKMCVARINETNNVEDKIMLLRVLHKRILEEGEAPTPMVDVNNVIGEFDPDKLVAGKPFQIGKEMRLRKDTMSDNDGNEWFPLFTDDEELNRQPTTNIIINHPIRIILEDGLKSDRVKGVVINPFGQAMTLPKEILKILFDKMEECENKEDDNHAE